MTGTLFWLTSTGVGSLESWRLLSLASVYFQVRWVVYSPTVSPSPWIISEIRLWEVLVPVFVLGTVATRKIRKNIYVCANVYAWLKRDERGWLNVFMLHKEFYRLSIHSDLNFNHSGFLPELLTIYPAPLCHNHQRDVNNWLESHWKGVQRGLWSLWLRKRKSASRSHQRQSVVLGLDEFRGKVQWFQSFRSVYWQGDSFRVVRTESWTQRKSFRRFSMSSVW